MSDLTDVTEQMNARLRQRVAEQSLDMTNPDDVQLLAKSAVAIMWGVDEEDVRIEHATLMDGKLRCRGAVYRRTYPRNWVEIKLDHVKDQRNQEDQ